MRLGYRRRRRGHRRIYGGGWRRTAAPCSREWLRLIDLSMTRIWELAPPVLATCSYLFQSVKYLLPTFRKMPCELNYHVAMRAIHSSNIRKFNIIIVIVVIMLFGGKCLIYKPVPLFKLDYFCLWYFF